MTRITLTPGSSFRSLVAVSFHRPPGTLLRRFPGALVSVCYASSPQYGPFSPSYKDFERGFTQ